MPNRWWLLYSGIFVQYLIVRINSDAHAKYLHVHEQADTILIRFVW